MIPLNHRSQSPKILPMKPLMSMLARPTRINKWLRKENRKKKRRGSIRFSSYVKPAKRRKHNSLRSPLRTKRRLWRRLKWLDKRTWSKKSSREKII